MILKIHILVLVSLFLSGEHAGLKSLSIDVIVGNIRSSNGKIFVCLFNQPNGFPKMDHAYRIAYVKIVDGKATARFPDLSPGEYAVSVFHDENGNKKLDRNFLGIPKEGVGASNNARGHFGPAPFHDAGFALTGESKTIEIDLSYL